MGTWIKERKSPSPYPKTEQQKKVAEAGKQISEECTGKTGEEFTTCRSRVLAEVFKKPGTPNPDGGESPPEKGESA